MPLEATLQTVFQVAVGLCVILLIAGFVVGSRTDRGAKSAMIAALGVLLLDVALVLGTRQFAQQIGPVITEQSMTIAAAVTFAYVTGLRAGRQLRQKQPLYGNIVLLALAFFILLLYRVHARNQQLAQGAKDLGVGQGAKYEPEKNKACPENLKSLYLAISSYAQDWDALPPAGNWLDNEEIASKIVQDEWMHCPEVSNRQDDKFGYAYNETLAERKLEGKPLNEMPDAATTPLVYDSTNVEKNAHDAATTLPKPGRHGGRNNILYLDGHVEAVAPEETNETSKP